MVMHYEWFVQSQHCKCCCTNTAILIRDTDHYLNSFSSGQASVGEWELRGPLVHTVTQLVFQYVEMLLHTNRTLVLLTRLLLRMLKVLQRLKLMMALRLVLVTSYPSQVLMLLQTQQTFTFNA